MVLIFSYISLEKYIYKPLILINFMINITGRNNQVKITDKVKNVHGKILTEFFCKKNLIEELLFCRKLKAVL